MHIIIPARYASTRLPGKPLADVAGKPLIQRVHDCAAKSGAARIVIATDDERIRAAAEGFGARVVMTSAAHRSGTDRLAEVIEKLAIGPEEIVVNLQGDEPLMPPELMREVAEKLSSHKDARSHGREGRRRDSGVAPYRPVRLSRRLRVPLCLLDAVSAGGGGTAGAAACPVARGADRRARGACHAGGPRGHAGRSRKSKGK